MPAYSPAAPALIDWTPNVASGLGMADFGHVYADFPVGSGGWTDLTQRWRVRILLAP